MKKKDERLWACEDGTFQGVTENGCLHLRGIRYADSGRFEKPVRYTDMGEIRFCERPAPFAIQLASSLEKRLSKTDYDALPQEENSQYLSLTMPETIQSGDRLPVLVWIHGGSYLNGGCDQIRCSRELLVKEQQVIVIGVNYRIGLLGFSQDENGQPGHPGLWDLIQALEWIHRNIDALGGDSKNVTLFGQSSGADAVRALMLARGTDTLYTRAILQSMPEGTLADSEGLHKKILKVLSDLPKNASLPEIREKQRMILKSVPNPGKHLYFAPKPGVDPLPKREEVPKRLAEIASAHDLLIGNTRREMAVYLMAYPSIEKMGHVLLIRPFIEAAIRLTGRLFFDRPTRSFEKAFQKAGGKGYRYTFSWGSRSSLLASCHTQDLLLLFGAEGLEGREILMGKTPAEVSAEGRLMRRVWCDFAKNGRVDPTTVPSFLRIEGF